MAVDFELDIESIDDEIEFDVDGIRGPKGDTGEQGVSIVSIVLNADYTLTITLSDGTIHTTSSIRGEKGEQGIQGIQGVKGDTGNGIASITKTATSGLVDTYTITYTDGNTATFTVTNGADGAVTNIDDTLTQQGKPADAKKVGDEISDIKADLNSLGLSVVNGIPCITYTT